MEREINARRDARWYLYMNLPLSRVTVFPAKTFRDLRSLDPKETGNERESKRGYGRGFERIINLFWCQRCDEYTICGMICLFKHIFPCLVRFECRKNGFGGCCTLKRRPHVKFCTHANNNNSLAIP